MLLKTPSSSKIELVVTQIKAIIFLTRADLCLLFGAFGDKIISL